MASLENDDKQPGFSVQEWADGSRYEGEFMNGLKHGKGKYTWKTGEYYEGLFYKDYCHGEGCYYWPTGHTFTGRFYLNRKEGYGQHLFPDGTSFQGLYHLNHRFGPGIMAYPDGCMDVGLWIGKYLYKLCDAAEDSFTLKNFPEYAAYLDSGTTIKLDLGRDQLLDDVSLPAGIEKQSADGDHSLLLPGQIRELDQVFFGELWEADVYQGKRDAVSSLTLQARMEAHIQQHRLLAENLSWDVGAVLTLNRDHFGPKGPLEVISEQLIQHASRGEVQAVSKIIQTGLVHPDVTDSRGNTALIVATVNCHHDVLHLLLDVGADIDKLNDEGMSALAVCHVLYYPFHRLHALFTESSANTRYVESLSTHGRSPEVDSPACDKALSCQSYLSDQASSEPSALTIGRSSNMSSGGKCSSESWSGLDESEKPSHTKQLQEEGMDPKARKISKTKKKAWTKGGKKRGTDSRVGQPCELRESEVTQEVVQESGEEKREVYLNTLKLLLKRGADANTSKIPMPVLFSSILACDSEGVKRLLLMGARTDLPLPPERKGLYPLHVAAALPGPLGPEIIEILLHTAQDPDARAYDHNEIFELDKAFMKAQDSTNENAQLKEDGRTALHVACQKVSDHQNATKIVALLLSHRANTDLLWSGHSPLSLAIATGNILAVEELLNGGANPNIPLGHSVGSALCAFANIHYTSDARKEKLLEMLVKAGADILMPIVVDGDVGTAVDYAYYSFNQDMRIAHTPFNALNMKEREIFKARCRLLCMMGDLMRQAAHQQEEDPEKEQRSSGTDNLQPSSSEVNTSPQQQPYRKPFLKFCYYCGRSVLVRLTPCYRCYKVFYCSRPCRLNAWDELHKKECIRLPAGAQGYESAECQNAEESSSINNIQEMLRIQINSKENYSFN